MAILPELCTDIIFMRGGGGGDKNKNLKISIRSSSNFIQWLVKTQKKY